MKPPKPPKKLLISFPSELLEAIGEQIGKDDLLALRLVSRVVYAAAD